MTLADPHACAVCGAKATDLVARHTVSPEIAGTLRGCFESRATTLGCITLCPGCRAGIEAMPDDFVSPEPKVNAARRLWRARRM